MSKRIAKMIAKLTDTAFDVLNLNETMSSITRTPSLVRLTYKDENQKLITFEKLNNAVTAPGTYLVAKHGALLPTQDKHRSVAKLLAHPSTAVESKTMKIGLINKTLHLLPVQII